MDVEQLAEIGYRGGCSIECRWTDLARPAPGAAAVVRAAAERAGLTA
jgi:hypothetical protein